MEKSTKVLIALVVISLVLGAVFVASQFYTLPLEYGSETIVADCLTPNC